MIKVQQNFLRIFIGSVVGFPGSVSAGNRKDCASSGLSPLGFASWKARSLKKARFP